jgi:NACHT conflict system protein/NACHT domain-containing protein
MPLHLVALVPSSSSISSFLGKQLKDPTMKALGMDPLSKALRKAIESFLLALEEEYQRHEVLHTLLQASVEESISIFVGAEPVQEVLAEAFRNANSFDASAIVRLWRDIPGPGGEGNLIELPPAFDWNAVGASYLQAVRAIVSETPQLREIWLANNVDDIRRSLESMRGAMPRFSLEDYRRTLIEDFGTLKLSAIRLDCDRNLDDRSVPLQKVYVQQCVKAAFPPRDLSRDYRRKLHAEGRFSGIPSGGDSEDISGVYQRAPVLPIREVLNEPSCRFVILGDPGLGKSTLLQHLALDWAQGASTSIPFVIELRKYTGDHAQPRNFLEFMESGTWSRCHLPQGELDQYMRERDVVVMFDGLDEIFDEALRSNIVTEIISFSRDYSHTKIIVTTRVMGYAVGSSNPDHFRSAGFQQVTLQYFSDSQIREFVEKWYASTILNEGERQDLAARLMVAAKESTAIRELAGNPLLLTMMVLLNRRNHLPRERLKLYEDCAELLVEGWDAVRQLDRSEYLTHEDKIEILQRVAFEMQLERDGLGGNMISESRLQSVLISALRDRDVSAPRIAAQKIVKALTERDFMLCSTGDNQFAFVHRTFLEYFCAREYVSHLANAGDKNELVELFGTRWPDDAWHEVLRLLCAMVGPDLASILIQELLDAGIQKQSARAIFLAAECVGEIRQAGRVEALRAAVHEQLVLLLEFEASGNDEEVRDEVDADSVSVRKGALDRIVQFWPGASTQRILKIAARNQYWVVRFGAVEALVKHWKDDATRQWLVDLTADRSGLVIQAAVHGLAAGWPDDGTRDLLLRLLESSNPHIPRSNVIRELSQIWPEQTTRQWLVDRAMHETDELGSHEAIRELARRFRDDVTGEWLMNLIVSGARKDLRTVAAQQLTENQGYAKFREQMIRLADQNEDLPSRDAALVGLSQIRDENIRSFILGRISRVEHFDVWSAIIWNFTWVWRDGKTKEFLLNCVLEDKCAEVHTTAIHQLARCWRKDSTQRLLLNRPNQFKAKPRILFVHELVRQWNDDRTRRILADVAAQDETAEVRLAALAKLVAGWPDEQSRALLLDRSAKDPDNGVRGAVVNMLSRTFNGDQPASV